LVSLRNGFFASGSRDGQIKIWNTAQDACLHTIDAGFYGIASLQLFGADTLASGSLEGVIKLWSLESYECLDTFESHSESISSIK